MSAYKPYPKTKDSGVEWLGEVPEGWEVWKLAHAFTLIGSGTTPKTDNREYYDEGNIPWVNTGDLNDGQLLDCEKRITALAIAHHTSLKTYPAGSLLIAMYGATIGKLSMLRFPATVNQACCVFAGSSPITSKFMFYWFLGLRQQIISLATGGGQPNVSQDILRTLRVACPASEEQIQIAAFLDRECGKLDALQAKQERLIELLKEKRQALISHAVTRGLDPAAKLKPSGIEWLGDVPEHWRTPPFYAHLQGQLGKMLDAAKITGEYLYPYLRNTDVQWNGINTDNLPMMDFSPADKLKFSLRSGDLLACEGGECGRAFIWEQNGTSILFQKALHRIRSMNFDLLNPKWMLWVLRAAVPLGVFKDVSNSATIDHLPAEKLRAFRFALPPLAEQSTIVAHLEEKCGKIDQLKTKAERGIDLLKERRSALISAAVTGKIDVRNA